MNLQRVEQCSLSEAVTRHAKVGPFELGVCQMSQPWSRRSGADCRGWVVDDGTGYADLDGPPFRAYVCGPCAARAIKQEGERP